jgi:hypothetical protein
MAIRDKVPSMSMIFSECSEYDYTDSFYRLLKRKDVESWELVAAFFMSAPKWVDNLMVLRNRLVSLIGLKGDSTIPNKLHPPYSIGQQIGTFQIQEISESEIVLGQNDKHLDFKTSLLIKHGVNDELVISTIVRTNNTFGKLYFFLVKPIHRLIVPIMIRRMVKNIDERLLPQYTESSI